MKDGDAASSASSYIGACTVLSVVHIYRRELDEEGAEESNLFVDQLEGGVLCYHQPRNEDLVGDFVRTDEL